MPNDLPAQARSVVSAPCTRVTIALPFSSIVSHDALADHARALLARFA